MKESNKIQAIEEYVNQLDKELEAVKNCLERAKKMGWEEDVEEFSLDYWAALGRWATANRILKFLKNGIKAEDL